ncbi:MAG: methyltransferase [Bryobacteraceae bacterium]
MTPNQVAVPAPNPALVWDAFNGYQKTAALKAGIELDLFTAVAEGVNTAEAIASRSNSSQRGIRILCDYLTVAGFLSKQSGRYSLPPTSEAFLNRHSPACMCSVIRFINSPGLMAGFSDLTETVRRGTTVLPHGGTTEAEFSGWETFAESMMPIVAPATEFVGQIAVAKGNTPRRVLDIAAGHGLFGISVARHAPKAEIVALDWPNVLKVAQKNAQAAGIADRYQLLPGDAFTVEFGGGYDVALLTNFLHHFDEPTCESLLKKLSAALNPGARVLTVEFVPNEDRVSPEIPATFALMMLGTTPNGDAYTLQQYRRMFGAAGFTGHELLPIPQSPQQLIISTKPQ